MRLNFKLIILFALYSGLYSCQKEVNLKIPDRPPLLVANALFINDSVITVNLSSTVKALSNQLIKYIDFAEVKVSDGLQTYPLPHRDKGNYYDENLKAITGVEYGLMVNAKGFASITAQTKLPTPMLIDTVFILNSTGKSNFKATLIINDPVFTHDYYQVCFYEVDSFNFAYNSTISLPSDNSSYIEDQSINSFLADGCLFFNDEFFNGKKIEQNFNFNATQNIDTLGNILPGTRNNILGEFSKVSKDYYLYKWSLNKYYETQNNPFSEPVQVYTNVKNGLGIIGSKTSFVRWVRAR